MSYHCFLSSLGFLLSIRCNLLCFALAFGSAWFGLSRFGSVRFSFIRFSSVQSGSVRFGSVRFESSLLGSGRFGSVFYVVLLGSVRVYGEDTPQKNDFVHGCFYFSNSRLAHLAFYSPVFVLGCGLQANYTRANTHEHADKHKLGHTGTRCSTRILFYFIFAGPYRKEILNP